MIIFSKLIKISLSKKSFEDSYKGITQFNLFQEIKYYNFDIEEKVPYDKENEFSLTLHLSLYALIFFKTLLDKLKEDKVELHTEEILFDPDFYFDYLKKTEQEEVSQVYENSQNQEEEYQDQEDQNTQEDQNDNMPENMPENSNYNNDNEDYNAQKQDQEEQYKDQYEDYS